MLLIVAHHYVVNSGIDELIQDNPLSTFSVFYTLFGAWGKSGINCFVLITGYYMCKSEITLRKFLKLFIWIFSYSVIINSIFSITGYHDDAQLDMWLEAIPFRDIKTGFTYCFVAFYLSIPFLNTLIQHISKKQHILLILLLLSIYTLHGSIPSFHVNMNYVSWFCVLYFISAFLRIYPLNNVKWGRLTILSLALSILSIFTISYLQTFKNNSFELSASYYFVSDSNAILALTNGITSFMWFKNLNIKFNRIINVVAASSFGVLLIHANSSTMRHWLWNDMVDCVGHYDTPYYWLYAIGSVTIIYAICTIIDIIRMKIVEKPLLNGLESFCVKSFDKFKIKYLI